MKRLVLISMLLAACGKRGADGVDGPAGPVGPIGPGSRAPEIVSIAPGVASPASIVRVRAAYVSSSASVVVDGAPATIVSVTMTSSTSADLRVTGLPAGAAGGFGYAEVSVLDDGRASAPMAIDLAPAGETRIATRGTLLEPRGMAPAADGSVLIFDLEAGVLRRDASGTRVLHPATLATGALSTGIAIGDSIYAGGTGGRIVRISIDGSVLAVASGLAADAVQMASDGTSLYWTDGTDSIKKLTSGADVVSLPALPQNVLGLARIGANLYATDAVGDLHQVVIATGAGSVLAAGLFASAPLAVDGADVIACVSGGAIRVTAAGVQTVVAPTSGLVDPRATGCAVVAGTLWNVNEDESVSSIVLGGAAWSIEDLSLDDDGDLGLWDGDRLVLVSRNRCPGFIDQGALASVDEGGGVRVFADDLCIGAVAREASGTLLVMDERNARVARADEAGGASVTVFAGGGGYRGGGLAISPDGSIFVARTDADVDHRVTQLSASGTIVAGDVAGGLAGSPRALAFGAGSVWHASNAAILRIPVDGQGVAGTPVYAVPPNAGFIGIAALAHDGEELWFALDTGELFAIDSGGSIRWVDHLSPVTGLALSPYGEIVFLSSNSFPTARLP